MFGYNQVLKRKTLQNTQCIKICKWDFHIQENPEMSNTRDGQNGDTGWAWRSGDQGSPLKKTNLPSLFSYTASIFAGRPLQNTLMSMGYPGMTALSLTRQNQWSWKRRVTGFPQRKPRNAQFDMMVSAPHWFHTWILLYNVHCKWLMVASHIMGSCLERC